MSEVAPREAFKPAFAGLCIWHVDCRQKSELAISLNTLTAACSSTRVVLPR